MTPNVTECREWRKGGPVMVSSAQLRAARAYLGWTMDRAAEDDDVVLYYLYRPCSNREDPSQWCVARTPPTIDGF